MKNLIFFIVLICLNYSIGYSQGCVAIRNISGFSQYLRPEHNFATSNWLININNRYFKAYRDFIGTVEQDTTQPQNLTISKSYNLDLSVTHLLNNGWSLSMAIPILANARESSMEHSGYNASRHTTRSFGLGDIRFIAAKWLLSPKENEKGNIQLGLGLKLPTGDYEYKDYFFSKHDSTRTLAPVNPAIQLGDGGLGLIAEIYAYYRFNEVFSIYTDLYYLSSPREQNGVAIRIPPNDTLVRAGANITSVTDVYSLRAGTYINLKRFTITAGVRYEGIPVNDFIGGSGGNRRPGYNLSFEPGITYNMDKVSFYTYVPFIVSRSIDQNTTDKLYTELGGKNKNFVPSRGGSGDYQLFFGALFEL